MKLLNSAIKKIDNLTYKTELIQYSDGRRVLRYFRITPFGVSKIPSKVETLA